MKIFVQGLWHCGCVISASLASLKHDVVAYDDNKKIINNNIKGDIFNKFLYIFPRILYIIFDMTPIINIKTGVLSGLLINKTIIRKDNNIKNNF